MIVQVHKLYYILRMLRWCFSLVAVCDDTCKELITPEDPLLVCTITGRCFDRVVSLSETDGETVSRFDIYMYREVLVKTIIWEPWEPIYLTEKCYFSIQRFLLLGKKVFFFVQKNDIVPQKSVTLKKNSERNPWKVLHFT